MTKQRRISVCSLVSMHRSHMAVVGLSIYVPRPCKCRYENCAISLRPAGQGGPRCRSGGRTSMRLTVIASTIACRPFASCRAPGVMELERPLNFANLRRTHRSNNRCAAKGQVKSILTSSWLSECCVGCWKTAHLVLHSADVPT